MPATFDDPSYHETRANLGKRSGDERKVVIVIPAGRRCYLRIVLPQRLREPGWDRLHVWINTSDPDDVAYLERGAIQQPRIRLVMPTMPPNGPNTVHTLLARPCVGAITRRRTTRVLQTTNDHQSASGHLGSACRTNRQSVARVRVDRGPTEGHDDRWWHRFALRRSTRRQRRQSQVSSGVLRSSCCRKCRLARRRSPRPRATVNAPRRSSPSPVPWILQCVHAAWWVRERLRRWAIPQPTPQPTLRAYGWKRCGAHTRQGRGEAESTVEARIAVGACRERSAAP